MSAHKRVNSFDVGLQWDKITVIDFITVAVNVPKLLGSSGPVQQ